MSVFAGLQNLDPGLALEVKFLVRKEWIRLRLEPGIRPQSHSVFHAFPKAHIFLSSEEELRRGRKSLRAILNLLPHKPSY